MAAKKKATQKTVIFTLKPPKSAYFVGREHVLPAKEAEEMIKQGWAYDPNEKTKSSKNKK